jgi:hypothetical protein
MIDEGMWSRRGVILKGEHRWTSRKTYPGNSLSTTNPKWTELGLHSENPATNSLSYGTTLTISYLWLCSSEHGGETSGFIKCGEFLD